MSFVALAWAKRQRLGNVAAKMVLVLLADYADDTGLCWPSQARLAAEGDLSERSVRDQLGKLQEAGLLTREKARKRDGCQDTNRFRLNLASRNDVPPEQAGTSCRLEPSRNEVSPGRQPERRSYPGETWRRSSRNDVPTNHHRTTSRTTRGYIALHAELDGGG